MLAVVMFACGTPATQPRPEPAPAPAEPGPVPSPPPAPPPATPGWEPSVACGFLAGVGLAAGKYHVEFEDRWICVSPYKDLGAGDAPNNVAVYVSGSATRATKLKLVLNVNDKASAKAALVALADIAGTLATAALGAPLPSDAVAALKAGKAESWTVAGAPVSAVRDDWPTGRGFEVSVVIEPPP